MTAAKGGNSWPWFTASTSIPLRWTGWRELYTIFFVPVLRLRDIVTEFPKGDVEIIAEAEHRGVGREQAAAQSVRPPVLQAWREP